MVGLKRAEELRKESEKNERRERKRETRRMIRKINRTLKKKTKQGRRRVIITNVNHPVRLKTILAYYRGKGFEARIIGFNDLEIGW